MILNYNDWIAMIELFSVGFENRSKLCKFSILFVFRSLVLSSSVQGFIDMNLLLVFNTILQWQTVIGFIYFQ